MLILPIQRQVFGATALNKEHFIIVFPRSSHFKEETAKLLTSFFLHFNHLHFFYYKEICELYILITAHEQQANEGEIRTYISHQAHWLTFIQCFQLTIRFSCVN